MLVPIGFLIYVNDVPDNVTSKVKLFADDTKLFPKIKNIHDSDERKET